MKYISIITTYSTNKKLVKVGDTLTLEKDFKNLYDDEAIKAIYYIVDNIIDEDIEDIDEYNDELFVIENCDSKRVIDIPIELGYVANSVKTVARGTYSAGHIYDKFDTTVKAKVRFIFKDAIIAEVVESEPKKKNERKKLHQKL